MILCHLCFAHSSGDFDGNNLTFVTILRSPLYIGTDRLRRERARKRGTSVASQRKSLFVTLFNLSALLFLAALNLSDQRLFSYRHASFHLESSPLCLSNHWKRLFFPYALLSFMPISLVVILLLPSLPQTLELNVHEMFNNEVLLDAKRYREKFREKASESPTAMF